MRGRCRPCGTELDLLPDGTTPRHYAPGLTHIYVSAKRCKGGRKAAKEAA